MADKKSNVKKIKEMGPPKSRARWPIGAYGMTESQREEYYEEALEDVAEALGTTPEKLSKNIAEKRFVSFPTNEDEARAYGSYNHDSKKLTITELGHKSPEEWKDTARHEIMHAAGVGHSTPKRTPETKWEPEESYYYRPATMQEPTKNPKTGEVEDTLERDRKVIKMMEDWGVENPEQALAEVKMSNELFGHGQRGVAKRAETEMPLEFLTPTQEERAKQVLEIYGPEWEEKIKKIKRLRERAYPTKGGK